MRKKNRKKWLIVVFSLVSFCKCCKTQKMKNHTFSISQWSPACRLAFSQSAIDRRQDNILFSETSTSKWNVYTQGTKKGGKEMNRSANDHNFHFFKFNEGQKEDIIFSFRFQGRNFQGERKAAHVPFISFFLIIIFFFSTFSPFGIRLTSTTTWACGRGMAKGGRRVCGREWRYTTIEIIRG